MIERERFHDSYMPLRGREAGPEASARTPRGKRYLSDALQSAHASAARARVLGLGSQVFWDAFGRLPQTVATGKTGVELAFGVSLWDYFDRHPEEWSHFNRWMAARHVGESEAVAAAYDWSGASRVMDVGGARAA